MHFLSLFSFSKCGFTAGGKKKVPTSFPQIDKRTFFWHLFHFWDFILFLGFYFFWDFFWGGILFFFWYFIFFWDVICFCEFIFFWEFFFGGDFIFFVF